MINTRKLIKMARKWQRAAAISRKRLSFPGKTGDVGSGCSSPSVAEKGHFVIYTSDQKRFAFPISYLNNYVFRELLRMSEEEFGLPSGGPIRLPCDAVFMEYVMSLIQTRAATDVQKALLTTIAPCKCWSSTDLHHQEISQQQSLLCGF